MKQGDILVIAIAPESGGIHAYSGFDTEQDAIEFIASDVLPVQYTQLAIVPVEVVRPLDEEE